MGVPVLLATMAATGSLVTSIKSSWELRRMIKKKQEAKECDEDAPYVFRRLRRAYYDGLMGAAEYEQWYEKFLVAKVEKDCKYSSRSEADGLQPHEGMWNLTYFRSGRDAQNPRTPKDPRAWRSGGTQPALPNHRAKQAETLGLSRCRQTVRGRPAKQGQPRVPSRTARARWRAP